MRSKFTPDYILQSIKGQVFSWKINQKELNSKLADLPYEKLEKLFILHDSEIVKQFSKCLHNCFFVLSKVKTQISFRKKKTNVQYSTTQ